MSAIWIFGFKCHYAPAGAKCWACMTWGTAELLTCKLWMQASLSRVGIDPTAALARARSQSRGRKRVRSEGPGDVEMGEAEQPKRLHSSKSRYFVPCRKFLMSWCCVNACLV